MRLSYSAISTYQKCPLSYRFLYVDKLPTKPSHHLSFGNTIHSVLEFFYKTGPAPVSLERLLQELEDKWLREGYQSPELEQEFKDKGRSILSQFYKDNFEAFALPLAVEKRFGLDIDGVTVSGIIDRIDRHPNGDLEIIDYKTNAKLPPKTKIATDLQLPIYHMAAQKLFGEAPKKVTLYFLVPNQKMSAQKTNADIDRTKKTILSVAGCIEKERFAPFKNPLCPWCDFIELCPINKNDPIMMAKAAANGKLANEKAANTQTSIELDSKTIEDRSNDNRIEEIVDEYIKLLSLIKNSRERIDEIKPDIHRHCQTLGLDSVSGSTGKIKRGKQKTTHYDVDKLRKILEPIGLWDKVLDVNGVLLKSILETSSHLQNLNSRINNISKMLEDAKETEEINYYLQVEELSRVRP
ncbi:MAG: PD-(D/E)XK nuclease family protein [Rubrobacteridae bacterium]|nr:PD-(D/E)XK nuclease family protein [Rubrobacteridae bacterium]